MSETNNEKKSVDSSETIPEAKVTATYSAVEETKKPKSIAKYVVAFVIVAMTLLVVLFLLEKEGRSSTGIFDGYFAAQEAATVVATVNGNEIRNSDLTTSIEQFNQAAIAQGVDVSNPEIKDEIKSQALDVLINTQLLRAEAIARGITVTEEEAAERLVLIESEIGGAEVLNERMEALGLNREKLESDIRDEILIQALLDQVFADADISISEEEVQSVYEAAGGADAGLPELEEVREQVESQIRSGKEQAAIDEFLSGLKEDADVVIL